MPRFQVETHAPADTRADLLLLPFYKGPSADRYVAHVGKALGADLVNLLRENRVKGKVGETLAVQTLGRLPAKSLLLFGLGERDEADPTVVRRAVGKVAARSARMERIAAVLPDPEDPEVAQALVEGLLLGAYRFDRYKKDGEQPRWESVTVLVSSKADRRHLRKAVGRAEILAEAAMWTRDLVNTPAIEATPDFLAKQAREMAREAGLDCKVWSKSQLEKGGFGGILGVGRGSVNEPRMIELRYKAGVGATIALSGKGITFDSGGLSLKDSKGMEAMKEDMAGAASVLGAMRAIAKLKPKINVIAAIPTAENMPSGSAIRPGDVLRHRGGRTSEVLNTDAEGRLILADSLAYLSEQEPDVIVDVATLTGACMIALGEDIWGVMANDRDVARELIEAGEHAGEPGWELPLWKPYRRHIESNVAEVKNVGVRWGGAITAALFLEKFVGDVPWAHMDIAGTAFAERAGDLWPKGATGNPMRTLVRFVEQRAATVSTRRMVKKRAGAKRTAAKSGSRS